MAVIKVKIFVSEITNVLTLFDVIQVQRSVTAPPAVTPVDLTVAVACPAELVGSLEGPFSVSAKSMVFKVNGAEITVTFVNPDPMAITTAVSEVSDALTLTGLAAVASDDAGKLKIETSDSGTQFTLEMISGSALAEFGFTAGQKDNGEAAYVILVADVDSYEFDDGSGQASYYYRTRFFNTNNDTYSAWSEWIQGTTSAALPSSDLIIAKASFAGLDGTALAGQRVTISNVYEPTKSSGFLIAGRSITLEADGVGSVETALVKGSLVDVIFHGTSIVRRIQVPDIGTEFDLLDDNLVTHDRFGIQVPDIPDAPRRS